MDFAAGRRSAIGSGWIIPLCLVLLVAGCGPSRMAKTQLEKARRAYAQAKADPKVERLAPAHLAEAGRAVEEAGQADSTDDMVHLSYLAEMKTRIAVTVAEGKASEDESERLNEETARAIETKRHLDRLRELEKKKALLEAEQAKLAAAAEVERAEQAKREAEQARLAAAAEAEKAARAKEEAEQARLAARVEAEKAARAKAEADMLMRELSELKAKQTERGIVLTIGDVLFPFGKADLSPMAGRNVEKLAAFLRRNPNRNVLIEGHTDSVGSDDYNLGLSRLRSESVKRNLVEDGIEGDRITTVGYGKKYPAVPNDTDAHRALNRRVEVIILNEGVSAESQMRE